MPWYILAGPLTMALCGWALWLWGPADRGEVALVMAQVGTAATLLLLLILVALHLRERGPSR